MGRNVVLGDVVELVAVLDKVAVDVVVGKETSVVVWAVVAAECVVVVNTAKDKSCMLCKSYQNGVCKYVNLGSP